MTYVLERRVAGDGQGRWIGMIGLVWCLGCLPAVYTEEWIPGIRLGGVGIVLILLIFLARPAPGRPSTYLI